MFYFCGCFVLQICPEANFLPHHINSSASHGLVMTQSSQWAFCWWNSLIQQRLCCSNPNTSSSHPWHALPSALVPPQLPGGGQMCTMEQEGWQLAHPHHIQMSGLPWIQRAEASLSLEMSQHNSHALPLRQFPQLEDDQCESPRRGWGGCDYWPEMKHTAGEASTKISSTGVSTSGQQMLLQFERRLPKKKKN